MKIGLVSPDPLYLHGGIQEHVKGLYRFLKSKGHKIKIIAPRYKKSERYKDVILVGKSIEFPWNSTRGVISFCFNAIKLKRMLEREKFDILHFHNTGLFTHLQIFYLSDSKNILTFHVLPEKSIVYALAKDVLNFYGKFSISKRLSHVIVTSKPVMKIIENAYDGPLSIIPNAVDLRRFTHHNKKIKRFLDGKVNILFVGRLDKRKGLEYLIKAFGKVKAENDNTRLIVVGDGYCRERCERIVKNRKIEDVVFVGYVNNKELPKYYATCDVFCSPATHGEGFGIVLLEAMASGRPIVAFANKGYKNVINGHAKNYLVKPRDVNGLARTLTKLVEDKRLRTMLGRWGLQEVKKYSWEKIGQQILSVYKNAMKDN